MEKTGLGSCNSAIVRIAENARHFRHNQIVPAAPLANPTDCQTSGTMHHLNEAFRRLNHKEQGKQDEVRDSSRNGAPNMEVCTKWGHR